MENYLHSSSCRVAMLAVLHQQTDCENGNRETFSVSGLWRKKDKECHVFNFPLYVMFSLYK